MNNQNTLEVDNAYEWENRYAELSDSVNVIKEMIDVRDGYKKCEGFDEIMVKSIIDDICIKWAFIYIALWLNLPLVKLRLLCLHL